MGTFLNSINPDETHSRRFSFSFFDLLQISSMMVKIFFLVLFLISFRPLSLFAQESDSSQAILDKLLENGEEVEKLKNFDINFLLRSSLNFSNDVYNEDVDHLRLDESRFELQGDINEKVSFRFRYRMNRSQAPQDLDNAPGALDIAALQYRFGKDNRWDLTFGKQAAEVGSWEFETNPTYEYHYTEYVNNILNLFLMAVKLGYEFMPNQTFSLQLHNTYNQSFRSSFNGTGYNTDGLMASSTPLGLYAAWRGGFADNKFLTFYSFNVSEYARGKTNTAVSLGNKVILPRFSAYLDLQTTRQAVDFTNLASPLYNEVEAYQQADMRYARNVNYKTAVLRLDYEFIPRWFFTTKGWYETTSMKENDQLGRNFRNRFGYWLGLEYKPVNDQNLRFFVNYFSLETILNNRAESIQNDEASDVFSVGFLYFINAL